METSKNIEKKIKRYIELNEKAALLKSDIEEWFLTKGINSCENNETYNNIKETISKGIHTGNVEETIETINTILRNLDKDRS